MSRQPGNRVFDSYEHLDQCAPYQFTLRLSMDEIAKQVCKLNYGVHRLLCALVKERLQEDKKDPLAHEIMSLLDKGYY